MAKSNTGAANRGSGGRNRDGLSDVRWSANDSPTPVPYTTLRINPRGQGGNQHFRSAQIYAHEAEVTNEEEEGEDRREQEEEEEPAEHELPLTQPAARTTRAGRATAKPLRYAEYALDDEIDEQVQSSPVKQVDDETFQPTSPRK
jgi:hypothetical protein